MATFKTILQDLINGAGKVNREQFLTDYHYKFFIEALNEIKEIENKIGYDYEFNCLTSEQMEYLVEGAREDGREEAESEYSYLEHYEDQVSDIQRIIDEVDLYTDDIEELRDALMEISNRLC